MFLINQTGSLLCGEGGHFELACLFWRVVCNLRGLGLNCKFLSIFFVWWHHIMRTPPIVTFCHQFWAPPPPPSVWCRFQMASWALHKKTMFPGILFLTIQSFNLFIFSHLAVSLFFFFSACSYFIKVISLSIFPTI